MDTHEYDHTAAFSSEFTVQTQVTHFLCSCLQITKSSVPDKDEKYGDDGD